MKQYKDLCEKILAEGKLKDDRTGIGSIGIVGAELRFDLTKGLLPVITEKKVPLGLIVSELVWFLRGDTNIRFLLEHNNHIWDEWPLDKWIKSDEFKKEFPLVDMTDYSTRKETDTELAAYYKDLKKDFCRRILNNDTFSEKWGDCGRAYGAQWRRAYYVNPETMQVSEIDQLGEVIEELKRNPNSRRLIVSSYNPDNARHAALPCCHHQFQFDVYDGKLNLIWDQRSIDTFLGLPFNITSYAILLFMVAKMTNLEVGELILHGKDIHIYKNHIDQVHLLLERDSLPLPTIKFARDVEKLEDYNVEDIVIEGYQSHGKIAAPVAI